MTFSRASFYRSSLITRVTLTPNKAECAVPSFTPICMCPLKGKLTLVPLYDTPGAPVSEDYFGVF